VEHSTTRCNHACVHGNRIGRGCVDDRARVVSV